jgi:hypothetical protein
MCWCGRAVTVQWRGAYTVHITVHILIHLQIYSVQYTCMYCIPGRFEFRFEQCLIRLKKGSISNICIWFSTGSSLYLWPPWRRRGSEVRGSEGSVRGARRERGEGTQWIIESPTIDKDSMRRGAGAGWEPRVPCAMCLPGILKDKTIHRCNEMRVNDQFLLHSASAVVWTKLLGHNQSSCTRHWSISTHVSSWALL